ncbi:S1 family peptidase [Photobacterium sp. SDRW27]|uniref:hypothetical protein n=1 Tax=Photobacterium obscurum TaxID=2829490 RepID=UPI0022442B75|nr:hypothetical protein [Photobacterium obscurum]MCW8330803.1 S1 family peptidase [Photobacterium obscurum]
MLSKRLHWILTLLLGIVFGSSIAWGGPPVEPPGLARAIEVQERHTDVLMLQEGVVGTAVGLRGDGVPVIKILVESPAVGGLPERLDGVPVAMMVTGKIYSRHHRPGHNRGDGGADSEDGAVDPTVRFPRPVPIGVTTGHPAITAGTIGARVISGTNIYALSNNHVYADENLASLGDEVIQPGAFDGGKLLPPEDTDYIGDLAAFVTIEFSTSAINRVDAAIASTTTELLGNATPSDGYGTPQSMTIAPSINMRVMKYGRTTGLTKGRISAINATVNVGYSTGVARFIDQIVVSGGGFSAGGDSGSLVVVEKGTNMRKPVGLLFAGSSSVTIANPIGAVLGAFNVSIDGD